MTREEAIKDLQENGIDLGAGDFVSVEALRMAIAALKEQEKLESNLKVLESSGWISVEERLPEPFVSVLVYMPEERPLPPVHEGFLAREGMWYANHFDRDPMEITHWMPLPEPPNATR